MTDLSVSVVIPAFNAGPWIAETLESVLGQTHPAREIIVVDDGSTDDTPARLEPYRSAIRYFRRPNAGQAAARNTGMAAASADYVALLDADDLWVPETLEVQLDVARRHRECGLVISDGVMFDGERVLIPTLLGRALAARLPSADGEVCDRLYREILRSSVTCPAQTLMPRMFIERLGPMLTERNLSSHWEYCLRVALAYPVAAHGRSLVRYRYRPNSLAGQLDRREFRWTLNNIPVLRQQLRVTRGEDRALVLQELRETSRQRAREAYYLGQQGDPAFARSYLRQLWGRRPGDVVVFGWLVAATLPDWLLAPLRRLRRLAMLWRP